MFPVAGSDFPTDPQQLCNAMAAGLTEILELPAMAEPVKISAFGMDPIELLSVRLDGARIDPKSPPPRPVFVEGRTSAFTATSFAVQAQPLLINQTPVQFKLSAENVNFQYVKDGDGTLWLIPAEDSTANNGHVAASAASADLKSLLVSVIEPLAKAQGISIVDLDIAIESIGPRSIKAEIQATGKKFGMKARVHVQGRVDIDDALNATLSNLEAGGEGFLGATVSGVLQPKLRQFNGKQFPLAALSLGGLKLRDLSVAVGADISIQAAFGSK